MVTPETGVYTLLSGPYYYITRWVYGRSQSFITVYKASDPPILSFAMVSGFFAKGNWHKANSEETLWLEACEKAWRAMPLEEALNYATPSDNYQIF